jgi:hypothetical protein
LLEPDRGLRLAGHCDGERDVTELAELTGASESLVADALHELRKKELLAAEPTVIPNTVPGVSRREAIVRVARVGAAAVGGALIVSATAATPAMALSREACTPNSGHNESCCICQDHFCITSIPEITSKKCEEECKTHGGLKVWAAEAHC